MLDTVGVVSSLLALSAISIFLNSVCLYVIRSRRAFRDRPSIIFLTNLFWTHLLQGAVVLPLYIGRLLLSRDTFLLRFLQNGFRLFNIISFYGVCSGVLLISVDRFLATFLLNKYKVYVTLTSTRNAVAGAWVYVVLLCLVPFLPTVTPSSSFYSCGTGRNNSGEPSVQANFYYVPQKQWTVFMLFCNALLPFVIIVVCYIYVMKTINQLKRTHVRRKESEFPLSHKDGEKKLMDFKRHKELTYLTLILSVVYFLLWTPSVVYYTVLSVCECQCFPTRWKGTTSEKRISFSIKYMSYLNALFSPVVYFFCHKEMRKHLVRTWRSLSARNKIGRRWEQERRGDVHPP